MKKNSGNSHDKDEYKFMEENEKEVELTIEDILMYSIENKYYSLIKGILKLYCVQVVHSMILYCSFYFF